MREIAHSNLRFPEIDDTISGPNRLCVSCDGSCTVCNSTCTTCNGSCATCHCTKAA